MVPGVNANGVAIGHLALEEVGVMLDVAARHEEGHMGIHLLQGGEHVRGPVRAGTVVERAASQDGLWMRALGWGAVLASGSAESLTESSTESSAEAAGSADAWLSSTKAASDGVATVGLSLVRLSLIRLSSIEFSLG